VRTTNPPIRSRGQDCSQIGFQFIGDRAQRWFATRDEHEVRAVGGEAARQLAPDAGGRAGDEGCFVGCERVAGRHAGVPPMI